MKNKITILNILIVIAFLMAAYIIVRPWFHHNGPGIAPPGMSEIYGGRTN